MENKSEINLLCFFCAQWKEICLSFLFFDIIITQVVDAAAAVNTHLWFKIYHEKAWPTVKTAKDQLNFFDIFSNLQVEKVKNMILSLMINDLS